MSKKDEISNHAIALLLNYPNGIHYTDLVNQLSKGLPDIPKNTIHGTVWRLDKTHPEEVVKVARGIWKHASLVNLGDLPTDTTFDTPETSTHTKNKEEDFYEPFADWLKNDLEECTEAFPLGGNKFGKKWGTPDVLGINKPSPGDIIQFDWEVISAEIKLSDSELIVAFGQTCSYKLFSHKCFLVVPKSSPEDDIARLDSLCLIFGIGLVLFDSSNPENPNFQIKTRPQKHEPDMFYVNSNLEKIKKELL